jgi:uncharacterized protein (UPF0335 family)
MARRKKTEEKAPEAKADLGHNSAAIELTPAERRSLFLNGLSIIEGLTEKKNSIVSQIRDVRKKLKANGFEGFLVDYARRLQKDAEAGEGAELDRRRKEMEVAIFMNHPIGTQPDLFEVKASDRAPDHAYREGLKDGASGVTFRPDYADGTADRADYEKGYNESQAALASGFKKLEPDDSPFTDEMLPIAGSISNGASAAAAH